MGMRKAIPTVRLCLVLFLLVCVVAQKELDCDPCIRRSEYLVRAIVHGTKSDGFWSVMQSAMVQAGRDMGIQLELELYEDPFDPLVMARDIRAAVGQVDVLIVTIPSTQVHEAIRFAVAQGLPVFGFNAGYEVAQELGLMGFVAQHEYLAGMEAAKEFQRQNIERPIQRALFINHAKGLVVMDERFGGFNETLSIEPEELVIDLNDLLASDATLNRALSNCPYDVVLSGGARAAPLTLQAAQHCTNTSVATFDEDDYLTRAIIQGKLDFAMSQQRYIQGVTSVVMASIYATTTKKLSLPLEYSGTYLSGPLIINTDNVPSDTQTLCEAEAYPVCPNNLGPNGNKALCPCLDRSLIRIAGVVHGVTTDLFWDPVFSVAKQSAQDLGIALHLDRLQPETNNTILYEKMASKIKGYCEDSVHGIFLTVPSSQAVMDSIKICQLLNVPVIAINSSPQLSQQLGIRTHIGQDDYSAGYEAGKRLIQAGIEEGFCVNHVEGNSAVAARCQGFADAINVEGKGSSAVTYGGMIIVPMDLDSEYRKLVEAAVGRDGDWEGIGLLLTGEVHVEPAIGIQKEHPKVLLGTFDVSEVMYPLLEDGRLLFTFDQQPYLQGAWPVYLLTYAAYSGQQLLNSIVQTGPHLVLSPPTEAETICQANLYRACSDIPPEDYNYISPGWLAVGYTFVALIGFTGIVCLLWLYRYRKTAIVRASQPPFLVLLVLGVVICGSSIIPMGIETGYRFVKDPYTGEFDEAQTNSDVAIEDAACMAVPWLYGVGFALMFSALTAKIDRVALIFKAGRKMKRRRVGYQHVMFILVIVLAIEIALLLSWQLVSPLRWEREAILFGPGGHALGSVGQCTSEWGWYFFAAIVGFNIACLFYALVACWRAKHIPSEFAESSWVSLSVLFVFQVSVLAIPIAAMVRDETDVFYFVRACALFLQSFTVLLFMFAPKMYRVLTGDDELPAPTAMRRSTLSSIHFSTRFNYEGICYSTCCEAEIKTICVCCGSYVTPDGNMKAREPMMRRLTGTGTQDHAATKIMMGQDKAEPADVIADVIADLSSSDLSLLAGLEEDEQDEPGPITKNSASHLDVEEDSLRSV